MIESKQILRKQAAFSFAVLNTRSRSLIRDGVEPKMKPDRVQTDPT